MYLFDMIVSNQMANAHIYNSQTMARDRCPRNFPTVFLVSETEINLKPFFCIFSNRMHPPPSHFSTSDFKRF
jgi:hypothetical protein